mgnify:FL=1|tara:strand:- start:2553 stop:3587 length:1035 start_codon:yes stop_codon:yes gene_type:complete
MSNLLFNNALNRIPQKTPPIWFMRQAGRYHSHYQNLKINNSFEDLCKNPKLAAQTALGPIEDFDFDVSILFSDILFPLEALGMDLKYNPGPVFSKFIDHSNFDELKKVEEAIIDLSFQGDALRITRDILPKNKSLIGFVGGPWTVTSYGTGMNKGVKYKGNFKNDFIFKLLTLKIIPLLKKNIELQISSGAEIVMIFDTDASRIGNSEDFYIYSKLVYDNLIKPFDCKVGFFAKHPFDYNFFIENINSEANKTLSGIGFDHTFEISDWLKKTNRGFVQGNFSQDILTKPLDDVKRALDKYIEPILNLELSDRAGWVCGLGHGILKTTPEENVSYFIKTIRENFK